MKRFFVLALIVSAGWLTSAGQVYFNPNIAIKPIPTLSIPRVELTDSTTVVTVRIVNEKQLPPFFIRTQKLKIRKVSDTKTLEMISSENVPFYPKKHSFSFQGQVLEFRLVFAALEKPVKYFDIIEDTPEKEFYIQGIVLDADLNRIIAKGFNAFQMGDREGALQAFIEMTEMDLYFDYGLAYFNIIYLYAQMNRWQEAKDWYGKFKNKFFWDRQLLENELNRLGILQRLN